MTTRRLGRTGLQISEMVFGGGWVGGILIDADDDTRRMAIRRAMDAGVNWVDTAPSYGQGQSEEALGWLLGELDERPMLSTKVAIDVDAPDYPGQIERSIEESLKRLKVDRVELFQLHNLIDNNGEARRISVDEVLKTGGIADTFDRLREQGLFDWTGITGLGDTKAITEVVESDRFDTCQVYYNLLNSSAGRDAGSVPGVQDFGNLMSALEARDMGVLVIRVFAAGVIATDNRTGREIMVADGTEVSGEEARARGVFASVGDQFGTRAQTALRYVLSEPKADGIVFGLASLDHLDEALDAWRDGPLDDASVATINNALEGGFAV